MGTSTVDARHRADWEQLAAVDPLWAVLSDPAKRGGRWNLEEFLATGVADAAALMTIAGRLGHPVRNGAALDFGAGVGRVSRALAATFESVVGVDVSASMVEQAQENCAELSNASFVLAERGTLTRMEPASFDLVYSRWVLQHLL